MSLMCGKSESDTRSTSNNSMTNQKFEPMSCHLTHRPSTPSPFDLTHHKSESFIITLPVLLNLSYHRPWPHFVSLLSGHISAMLFYSLFFALPLTLLLVDRCVFCIYLSFVVIAELSSLPCLEPSSKTRT